MKKGQKYMNRWEKPYFQTDHTGNSEGVFGQFQEQNNRKAREVSKKRKKKHSK